VRREKSASKELSKLHLPRDWEDRNPSSRERLENVEHLLEDSAKVVHWGLGGDDGVARRCILRRRLRLLLAYFRRDGCGGDGVVDHPSHSC
jgi:hypothetical protein